MTAPVHRVLAIDPATLGFAFGVFEGRDDLIDWGFINIMEWSDKAIKEQLDLVLERACPDCLILEKRKPRKRRADGKVIRTKGQAILRVIKARATKNRIPIVHITRAEIRTAFKPAMTKHDISRTLSQMYPALAPRLPRQRMMWDSEDYRMNIFDAVSFGYTAFETNAFPAL